MKLLQRRAMLFPALAFALAACSDGGPSANTPFAPGGTAGIAGVLTAEPGSGLSLADDGFEGGEAVADAVVEISDDSGIVFSTATDDSGQFSGELAPGTYTVSIRVGDEEYSFVVDVEEGEMLFVRAKVQATGNGDFKVNFMIFNDENGDGEADDNFRIRITGREADDLTSGVVDISTAGDEDEGAMCHVPPGNPENEHTIVVSENAKPAHIAHGDEEGPCEGDTVDDETGEGDEVENGDGDGEKVVVCHIPPGNQDNPRTIEIGADALEAHIAHGDTEGECPDPADESDGGDGGDGGDGS